jgi:phage gpG-like protein
MISMNVQIYRDEATPMLRELRRRMPTIDRVVRGAIADTIVGHIQRDKLRGQVLHRRTGDLAASTHWRHLSDSETAVGTYGVIYARIHELGGIIKHPGGTHFFIHEHTGLAIFVNKKRGALMGLPVTKPHDIRIPQRSYLRTGIQDIFEGGDSSEAVMVGEQVLQSQLDRLNRGAA